MSEERGGRGARPGRLGAGGRGLGRPFCVEPEARRTEWRGRRTAQGSAIAEPPCPPIMRHLAVRELAIVARHSTACAPPPRRHPRAKSRDLRRAGGPS